MEHACPSPESWTVTCVRYSPDGRLLASSEQGRNRPPLGCGYRPAGSGCSGGTSTPHSRLAFEPGSRLLASGGDDGDILIWDTVTGSLVRTLPKSTETIYALGYSPDGRLLASGHGYPPLEEVDHMRGRGVVRLWDAASGRLLRTLRGHTQNVTGVAFSPDGLTLASVSGSSLTVPQAASKPGELILWNTETGKLVRTIDGSWRSA